MRAVELPIEREIVHRRRRQHRRHPRRARASSPTAPCGSSPTPQNQGKGAAIRTGLEHVTGDLVLIQDADLEYDPEDWPKLLAPDAPGQGAGRLRLALHRRAPQHAVPALGRQPVPLARHQRALQHDALRHGDLLQAVRPRRCSTASRCGPTRFEFEPEVTAKVLRQGIRIYEVPISYAGREFDEGKKITWRDGFVALVDARQVPLRRLRSRGADGRVGAALGGRSSSTTSRARCSLACVRSLLADASAGRARGRRRRQRLARRLGRRVRARRSPTVRGASTPGANLGYAGGANRGHRGDDRARRRGVQPRPRGASRAPRRRCWRRLRRRARPRRGRPGAAQPRRLAVPVGPRARRRRSTRSATRCSGGSAPANRFTRRYRQLDADPRACPRRRLGVGRGDVAAPRARSTRSAGGTSGYFMYVEDVDLCWRLRRLGWRVAYEPGGERRARAGREHASRTRTG